MIEHRVEFLKMLFPTFAVMRSRDKPQKEPTAAFKDTPAIFKLKKKAIIATK
jgi:hypothetical protein